MRKMHCFISLTFVLLTPATSSAQPCGGGGGESPDAMCPKGLCSAGLRFCGSGFVRRCGSDLTNVSAISKLGGVISAADFDGMLKHRNDRKCEGNGFYSYEAFVMAAAVFDGFGTTGNLDTRKREVAAFLAQTSHETKGAADGPYAWGYCYVNSNDKDPSCISTPNWPCASGKHYYGRGPFQITYNFNYGAAGKAIGVDLINNPDLVATNPIISFKTALWFWMTSQGNKPSCHDVMTGKWIPSDEDISAKRFPGYGLTINLIGGINECSSDTDARAVDRVGFFQRYCDILNIPYGDNLDCFDQKPFT
ncbi:basic endochitinase-like isoform X2 [Benincasa hispida]|uniref:basic endochitinase-like isoform X2 n=1 Tax=Benincasa hispida TaxID=102211 RepID=UPI001901D88C|nr:basic endochitinase-like isoform X2 [Benincasa hispida]